MNPEFSILMANYNKGEYISEAIESVLNQTFQKWELIIMDDYSQDDSVKKIKNYLTDQRIRLYINKKNRGTVYCQKRLVDLAASGIVGILDSDDSLEKDAIKNMYALHLNGPDYSFIYSGLMICDEYLTPIRQAKVGKIPAGDTVLRHDKASAFRTFKKSHYFKTEGYDQDVLNAEDKDLIIKLEEVGRLHYFDKILYNYRLLPTSRSHSRQNELKGAASHALARFKAYKRRLGTDMPNLSKQEIAAHLRSGSVDYFYCGHIIKSFRLFFESTRLEPLNFKGYFFFAKKFLQELKHSIYLLNRYK